MMMNFKDFFKQKMVRFFAILFAIMIIIGNLGFYIIAKVQFDREVNRQNSAFVAMVSHLLSMENTETTLVYLEHYDHTHGVRIAFWNEFNELLFESDDAPISVQSISLYDSDQQYLGKVTIDNQSSFFGQDISFGLIIYNGLTLILFFVGLWILKNHLDKQYSLLKHDMDSVGSEDNTFTFSDIESVNERYIKALNTEMELKAIQSHYVKVLAHDIKTPLTVMKAYIEGMQSKRLEYNQEIENVLLEEILEIEKLVPQFIATELNQLAIKQNITPIIKNHLEKLTSVFKTKSIELEYDLEDFELQIASADVVRLIEHLTFNAFYYSNSKTIIKVSINAKNKTISVQDQGIGMSQDTIDKLNVGPYRNEDSIKFHQKGSGIGLQIVKDIMHKYHGCIRIESTLGSGSTVTLEF
ncbi:MAG: hypothetical protein CVV56_01655 [Tenericutes bacterium HGW-Tenericutes-1]|jgi:signal transduction histidine kinase|nr:MAG: hypothetical protein CVV56_01655 [Tenericutes bacterium HGW-Tenericutes-1]